ncbi:hypothetical protein F5Y13DRAFT_168744 [Hypoxylon sp. FL1857]|nr:hypothetical protein F5Y13DRAFT_168744 [Hypoxylon sp. FL1857]
MDELSNDLQATYHKVDELDLPDSIKSLIKHTIASDFKITPENVLRIWTIPGAQKDLLGLKTSILWLEKGNKRSGKEHILIGHGQEFLKKGIPTDKLEELAEATTTVGYHSGKYQGKGKGRPILLLHFYDKPVAVAISVESNGYVVGMNPRSFNDMMAGLQLPDGLLESIYTWPQEQEKQQQQQQLSSKGSSSSNSNKNSRSTIEIGPKF